MREICSKIQNFLVELELMEEPELLNFRRFIKFGIGKESLIKNFYDMMGLKKIYETNLFLHEELTNLRDFYFDSFLPGCQQLKILNSSLVNNLELLNVKGFKID